MSAVSVSAPILSPRIATASAMLKLRQKNTTLRSLPLISYRTAEIWYPKHTAAVCKPQSPSYSCIAGRSCVFQHVSTRTPFRWSYFYVFATLKDAWRTEHLQCLYMHGLHYEQTVDPDNVWIAPLRKPCMDPRFEIHLRKLWIHVCSTQSRF